MSLDERLSRLWYGPRWRTVPLWPLAGLYACAVALRGLLYRAGWLASHRVAVPVVVVGNLTVGGTGKTPVAAWLARQLSLRGRRVGVVLRGYGGRAVPVPVVAGPDADPRQVGDEAVLHALRRPHVVVVHPDRVAAARRAAAEGAEIVVCDDGLQHLRLARDYEVVVVDGARGFGNGLLLPAGPLRESTRRLERVDAVCVTDRGVGRGSPLRVQRPRLFTALLRPGEAVNLRSGEHRPLVSFRGRVIHAVAGIGNPEAYFDGLRAAGLELVAHALPDHAAIDPAALPFPAGATVLMTEKDAVKCRDAAGSDWWFVELDVGVEREAGRELLAHVLERTGLTGAGVHLG